MSINQVKILSFGCRLNNLEAEKIRVMLAPALPGGCVLVNTCAVTQEAERQSRQAVRKIARENPGVPIFITGCAATRAPEDYEKIPGITRVIKNDDKLKADAYGISGIKRQISHSTELSKAFIQIQNGCNHKCAYCIVSTLRGKNVSFPYGDILAEASAAVQNGFSEIVLTGVDIAGYIIVSDKQNREAIAPALAVGAACKASGGGLNKTAKEPTPGHSVSCPPRKGGGVPADAGIIFLSDLCEKLLADEPGIKRLRLSSLDPASPEIPKIIALMSRQPRMLPHLHLSMQSGSDAILYAMRRRHNAEMVRRLIADNITFSWDLICGFPGETPELFDETCALIRELKPIKIHAFPFSPRPGTPAAALPDQIAREESKRRVRIVQNLALENLREFISAHLGTVAGVLMEENNIGRTPDDIAVKVLGAPIPARTICDIRLDNIDGEFFIGTAI